MAFLLLLWTSLLFRYTLLFTMLFPLLLWSSRFIINSSMEFPLLLRSTLLILNLSLFSLLIFNFLVDIIDVLLCCSSCLLLLSFQAFSSYQIIPGRCPLKASFSYSEYLAPEVSSLDSSLSSSSWSFPQYPPLSTFHSRHLLHTLWNFLNRYLLHWRKDLKPTITSG